jgi:DNA-binding MurR/RpiR family transcriptional regulator
LRFKLTSEILNGGSVIAAGRTEDAIEKARAMLRLGAKRLVITDEHGTNLIWSANTCLRPRRKRHSGLVRR